MNRRSFLLVNMSLGSHLDEPGSLHTSNKYIIRSIMTVNTEMRTTELREMANSTYHNFDDVMK